MRNFIWRWLGLDTTINNFQDDIKARAIFEMQLKYTIEQGLSNMQVEIDKIKQELPIFKLPPQERLAQLKGGIDILTSFANELQRDIERT